MSLTEKRVRDLKPEGRQKIIWDAQIRGLGCRVSKAGSKAYIISYRTADGTKRQPAIGRPAEISLAEARTLAARELAAIRQGKQDLAARREAQKALPTVGEGMKLFFDIYVPKRMGEGRMSDRTATEYRAQWNRICREASWFVPLRIEAVAPTDIERLLSARKPVDRNRNLAFLGRVFRFFEMQEFRSQHTNPARLVEKAREEPRDRVLTPDELQRLAAALTDMENGGTAGAPSNAIRFLMLTGWRTGEALNLKWEHVNAETGEILLPVTKTGRQKRTIGTQGNDLLAGIEKVDGNPFVFAGRGGRALSYKRVRTVFRKACDAADVTDANLHDLRRTVATIAAASGLNVTLLRDLLGHRTLTMAARYARRADAELKQAQDESAARMAALMQGKDNVVPMQRRRVNDI